MLIIDMDLINQHDLNQLKRKSANTEGHPLKEL